MSELEKVLQERGNQNGDYGLMTETIQQLKSIVTDTGAYGRMTPYQRESMDMILHKVGRIATGDVMHEDHWRDIAGYATLSADRTAARRAMAEAAAPVAPAVMEGE